MALPHPVCKCITKTAQTNFCAIGNHSIYQYKKNLRIYYLAVEEDKAPDFQVLFRYCHDM